MTAVSNQDNQAGEFARKYQSALRRYLTATGRTKPAAALRQGRAACRLGLDVLGLAAIQEQALAAEGPAAQTSGSRRRRERRAAVFFAEAIIPIETTHRTAIENNSRLKRLNHELEQRTRELSNSRRTLHAELTKRRTVEHNLRQSQSESTRLLRQARKLQEDLRRLSRRILTTQEDERKRISRELHDIVAQTLTSINVHLETLKAETAKNAVGMKSNITRTQKLVERSVDRVHRFARELRPAVLDDLGLLPALRSLMKRSAAGSGLRINMTACAKVEELNSARRTVLYRVAQEALMNVTRHARADNVRVNIKELSNAFSMQIQDDGRSFDVERLLRTGKSRRMGLLGMRERVEMVGGRFFIKSTPGKGTIVTAQVPFRNEFKESR